MTNSPPPRFLGAVFDMDGVLIDSEPLHARAWSEVLPPLGVPCDEDWFRPWIGVPDTQLVAHLLEAHALPVTREALLEGKRQQYRRILRANLRAFSGVAEGLARLADLPCAVATSSSREDATLALGTLGLVEHFKTLVCWEDVTEHKPAPAPYLLAARRLGIAPEHCVAVEDSPAGVASAKAAGYYVLGLTTSHPAEGLHPHADRTFRTTAQALAWIAEVSMHRMSI